MTRRGFALLTVLWLLAACTVAGAAALAAARLGAATSANRIALTRAAWAREACAEILLGRYAASRTVVGIDTIELGRGTWCRVIVEDAAARLDLNRAPAEVLRRLLGSDTLTDALLDWRDPDDVPRPHGAEGEWYRPRGRREPRNGPLAAIEELRLVRGFDSAMVAGLAAVLTVGGAAQVDVNAAPPALLAALPGLDPGAAAGLFGQRALGRRVPSGDELLAELSSASRQALLSRYQDYSMLAAYVPRHVVFRIEGGVRGRAPVSAARITTVPLPARLAVIRRQAE